ncbi:hypothetical protein FNF28_05879 [Cafeteria roenbergensis]|nr:hypothetical protein FNF28_05879 [Cafeteria roenbergensis]
MARASPATFFVSSTDGKDSNPGTSEAPFATLTRARDAVRGLRDQASGMLPAGGARVLIRAGDYANAPADSASPVLLLDPALDSGDSEASPVVWAAASPEQGRPRLLGGPVTTMSRLQPCGGEAPSLRPGSGGAAAALARAGWRLPAGALCLDLVAAMGGNRSAAAALVGPLGPGGLGQCSWQRGEVSWAGRPLTLARWPNTFQAAAPPAPVPDPRRGRRGAVSGAFPSTVTLFNWTHIEAVSSASSFRAEATRPLAWAAECGGEGGDCWLHGFWKYDWADSYVRLSSVAAAPGGGSLIATDKATPPVYGFEPKARFYGVSLLSELDAPGEYFIDRQSLRAFILPPEGAAPTDEVAVGAAAAIITTGAAAQGVRSHAAAAGASVAATRNFRDDALETARSRWEQLGEAAAARRAAAGAPVPLAFVAFQGLQLRYGFRGISVGGAQGVTVKDVDSAGMTHVGLAVEGTGNVVDGANVSLAGCAAAHVGGGVEATLQPGGNTAAGVVAVGYGRLTRTYTPGMSWGGVGNTYRTSSIGHAPHNAWLGGGNNNVFEANQASLLCFEVSDSGAWYSGRSWAHRNNTLRDNTIANVVTMEAPALGASSIQAVYNDDQLSANSFLDNDFVNVHAAMFIGGGRRHVVSGNSFRDASLAVHIDDRGLTWQKSSCNPINGSLVAALDALHYQQPPWSTAYPLLANITQDHPCVPVYNLIVNNCFQNVTTFTDVSPEHQSQWMETYANNTSPCW